MPKLTHQLGMRFWVETIGAFLTGSLVVLTMISMEWIEATFGVDPDNQSGSLEVLLVLVLAIATVALSLLARREWRRAGQLVAQQP